MKRINIPDLLPNTNYALRVRVKNGDALSDWSPIVNLTTITDVVPPAVPANTTWVVNGDSFHGEWDAVTVNTDGDIIPITRYEVELVGNSITKIVSTTPVIDNKNVFDLPFDQNTSLFGGVAATVTFRVRAVDNKELKSAWSTVISVTNPPPGNPSGFTAIGGVGTIDLGWTAPSDNDLVGYELFIGATKIWGGNATRFTFQTTTYTSQTFTVKAVDKFQQRSTGVSTSGTATSPFIVDTVAPAQPTGIGATITTANDFALTTDMVVSWTAVANPTNDLMGYQVRYKKTSASTYDYINVDNATTAVTIRGLEPYVAYNVSVQAFDFTRNYSGFPANVTATAATNTAPSQPAAPTVASNTLQIQVTITGNKQAGGAMEADVIEYEVYAANASGFTPGSTNLLGKVAVGPAMSGVFPIPATGTGSATTETWYAKVIAVDKGGLKSTSSPASSGTNASLVSTANIGFAQITDAKITDLTVTKLTAGSGVINDFTVKAALTIGDVSNSGYIRSFDYISSGGATGYEISKSAITIRNGTIYAGALQLQYGNNLLDPAYADFEYNPLYYPSKFAVGAGSGIAYGVEGSNPARFNSQYGYMFWLGTQVTNPIVYIGSSATDYNVKLNAGDKMIYSGYFWPTNGTIATNAQFKIKYSDGTTATIGTGTLTVGMTATTSLRLSGALTVPAGVTGGVLYIESSTFTAAAGIRFDGLQVEYQETGATTPSPWSPPGTTKLDGYGIRTGAILSTATAQVWDTNTNPGTGTNITVTINGTTTITSSTNDFLTSDIGKIITHANIPAGATITAVASASSATLSAAATGSATNTTAVIYRAPIGGYKTDPSGAPAWSINTAGSATFGNALVRGALVVGYVNSGGTTITDPNLVDTTKMGYMSSATYVPGSEGWILRSDGSAEFRRVAVGSFNGNAVAPGTLAADRIDTGIMSADMSISGSFETAQTPTNLIITTNSTINIVATTGQFYPEDVGSSITGSGIPIGATIATVTSTTTATISGAATASATGVSVTVYRGRRVRIDPTGITMYSGVTESVKIPTNPTETVKFAGSVTTSDLYVGNNFRMFGANNSIGRDAIMQMDTGSYTPILSPNISFDWEAVHLKNAFGSDYTPNTDPYINTPVGFTWEPTFSKYYYVSEFFGTNITQVDNSGNFNIVGSFNMNVAFHNGSSDVAAGGMEQDGSGNMYFLTNEKGTNNWRLQAFTKTAINNRNVNSGHMVADQPVPGISSFGLPTGFPSFGIYGTQFYIAKITSTGNLVIQRYNSLTNVAANSPAWTAAFGGFGNPSSVVSCRVGTFDMGGVNVYIVITAILSSGFTYQWVYQDNGSTAVDTGLHFPVALNKGTMGITWVGSSNNDSSGFFRTLSTDGYIYKYTPLGKTNTATTIRAQQRWRGDGTGGSTIGLYPLGTIGPETWYYRRARLTVTSRETVPNAAPGPNAVSFYIGTGTSTPVRYPNEAGAETAASVNYIRVITDFRATDVSGGGFTTTALTTTGQPGKITSSSGMYIQGDGHAHFPGTGWQYVSAAPPGGTVGVTFTAGWTNFSTASFGFARYRRVGTRVDVEGLVTRSSGTSTIPFTLPSGFRPNNTNSGIKIFISQQSNAAIRMDVYPETGAGAGNIDFPSGVVTGGYNSVNVSFYID